MNNEDQKRGNTWEENTLQSLYHAFAASDTEGRKYFLNLVLENLILKPSFLEKLYERVSEIHNEGIHEISPETQKWVNFWKTFNRHNRENIANQLEKLYPLSDKDDLSEKSLGYLYFLLASMEANLGKNERAVNLYRKSSQFLPGFSWIYHNWGCCLRDLGKPSDAIEKFKKATELDPKFALAYVGWGSRLRDLGNTEEAIEKYKKAIELNPNLQDAYNGLAYLQLKQKNLDDACINLEKAVALNPGGYAAPINLGICYYLMGDKKRAQDRFLAALEEYDENSVLSSLNRLTALVGLEEVEKAIDVFYKTKEKFQIDQGRKTEFLSGLHLLLESPSPPSDIEQIIKIVEKEL
jgi:tetratricopeptide (TPR) repeat protein